MTFTLQPVPPFSLALTAWAIRRRPENLIDRWDGKTYRRVLAVGEQAVQIAVSETRAKGASRIRVTTSGAGKSVPPNAAVIAAVERLLGIHVNLDPFYRFAATQPRLNQLASRFHGLKPPRFPTVFEALVNAIACQQLSLAVGITLLNRLSAARGLAFDGPDGRQHAFPRPVDLAGMKEEDLRPLGFSRAKSRALLELAELLADGRLDLEAVAKLPNEEALARLLELRGVGRWSAEYVLLRGLGRTSLFPGDDVGARNNLARWLRLRKPLDYDRVGVVLGAWQQYGGLIYFHLLLSGLERSGSLPPARAEEV